MIPLLPIVFVRRTDGPRGRGLRMLGYAQLPSSVALMEANAAACGYETRTRVVPQGRAERILDLITEPARRARPSTGNLRGIAEKKDLHR